MKVYTIKAINGRGKVTSTVVIKNNLKIAKAVVELMKEEGSQRTKSEWVGHFSPSWWSEVSSFCAYYDINSIGTFKNRIDVYIETI